MDFILQHDRRPIVIADMMAGVGPFAIPLAMRLKAMNLSKSESHVHANDLNPESYKYLCENIKLNNCSSHITPYNMDGRDFIHELDKRKIPYTDVIMNLPQSAIDFLNVFIGINHRQVLSVPSPLPMIHVYAFSSDPDPINDIRNRVASVLQCEVSLLPETVIWSKSECRRISETCSIAHVVRDVAPKKVMVCFFFQLPQQVLDISLQQSLTSYFDDVDLGR